MKKPRSPMWGSPMYPSSSARNDKSRIGVTPLLRCRQCGAVNNTQATSYSETGDGLVDQEGGEVGEQRVGAGCWFCGSLFWRDTRPPVYPNDERIPDGHIKKRRR